MSQGLSEFEIVVVGGGLAGCTAGLFSSRLGRSTVVLNSGPPGGQLLNVGVIEDFPGFDTGVAGFEFCPSVQDQALAAGATFETEEAVGLEFGGEKWIVITNGREIMAGAVIAATGSRPRELGVPGEREFTGRGVSQCATCDGPLYTGQAVGVVGGGDSALQEALELTQFVDRVIMFHRGRNFSGQHAYQARVAESPNIEVRFNTVIDEIRGDAKLSSVTARDLETGETAGVELGGLFVYVGSHPNADFLPEGVDRDHHGRMVTDTRMRTRLQGLLAAGDVRSDSAAQAVAVAGDGATAAVNAHRFLAGEPWPTIEKVTSAT